MNTNRRCLFCGRQLAQFPTNEHVILESLGGSLSSDKTICAHCNSYFSSNADNWLARKFSWVLNSLGPAIKTEAPTLHAKLRTGEQMRISPGMSIGPAKAKIEKHASGKVSVFATDTEHGKKILKSMGKSTQNLDVTHDISSAEGEMVLEKLPIFSDAELRCAGKSLAEFVYLRYPALLTNRGFSAQRRYIRNGIRNAFPPPTIYSADYFSIKSHIDSHIRPTPFCHRIAISMGPNGVVGLLVLFDTIPYLALLSSTYLGPPRTYLYQRNILKEASGDQQAELQVTINLGQQEHLPNMTAYLESQGGKLKRLYADANWHVEVNCKSNTCAIYLVRFIQGRKPGEVFSISGEEMLAAIWRRIERIFFTNIDVRELRQESLRIKSEVEQQLLGKSWSITPENQPSDFHDALWEAHLHAFQLHRKHVYIPNYGIKSFGFVADDSA